MRIAQGKVQPLYAYTSRNRSNSLPSPVSTLRPALRRLAKRNERFTVSPVLAQHVAETSRPRKQTSRQAILLQRFKGHNSAVTAVVITADTENGKEIVTSSLDKSVAMWELPATDLSDPAIIEERGRMTPAGGPVFTLVQEPPSYDSARRQLFCGSASKCVLSCDLQSKTMDNKVKLNGHTGWVRALATNRRWLFSSGCNKIAQWDLSRSVPRKYNELTLYTGDVTGLAYGDGKLFSCGADGSIRSWAVGKKGELEPLAQREKAHSDRVSSVIYKKGFLYSVSLDGSLKMWSAQNLELVQSVKAAHNGGKVHCLTAGPDGNLYTGGDDKMIRRWQLGSLDVVGGGVLYCHNYSVRALAAGSHETLVSADSAGEIAVWKV